MKKVLAAVVLAVAVLVSPIASKPAEATWCNYSLTTWIEDRHDGWTTQVHDLSTFGWVAQNIHVKDKGWNYSLGIGPLIQPYDMSYGQAVHPNPYRWQWATGFNMGGGDVRTKAKVWGIVNGVSCENFVVNNAYASVSQIGLRFVLPTDEN